MDNIIFKKAESNEEIIDNLNIRKIVFRDEQNIPEEIEFDGLDEISTLYIGYLDNIPISASRIRVTDEQIIKFERICIKKEFRNKGIGNKFIKFMLNDIKNNTHYNEIILSSQVNSISFYKKLGFKPFGDEITIANIKHIYMKIYIK